VEVKVGVKAKVRVGAKEGSRVLKDGRLRSLDKWGSYYLLLNRRVETLI
jgi:hypothetical protein